MKKIVVLTGAGISAESGLKTFRDSDGLWENYKIEDVATFDAWKRNPELVQGFYNERRKQVLEASPNNAHLLLQELENYYDVTIITQNIDDLHERAGSKKIVHLHGEITKARSTVDKALITKIIGWEIKMGDKCANGSQLRPHIVWFGEEVPQMEYATILTAQADILIIVGTSMQVYPAASLINYINPKCVVYTIDPNIDKSVLPHGVSLIKKTATLGMKFLFDKLIKAHNK